MMNQLIIEIIRRLIYNNYVTLQHVIYCISLGDIIHLQDQSCINVRNIYNN